jgi:hypothetical protein
VDSALAERALLALPVELLVPVAEELPDERGV